MGTVAFCPMFTILFVGTRMSALQMTNNKSAPEGWAQNGMYLTTWSIFVQLFMVIIAGVATGEEVKTDANGRRPGTRRRSTPGTASGWCAGSRCWPSGVAR